MPVVYFQRVIEVKKTIRSRLLMMYIMPGKTVNCLREEKEKAVVILIKSIIINTKNLTINLKTVTKNRKQ